MIDRSGRRWVQRSAQTSMHASLAAIGVVYLGLPLYVGGRALLRPRPVRPGTIPLGTVSVVIAAHDEEATITATLDRLHAQRCAEVVEIVVASDGSTDRTVELARTHPIRPVVLDLPRGGKSRALEQALEVAVGDIVVFTDANTELGDGAIEALLRPLTDPAVGGVAGDQRYGDRPSGTARSERGYWSYERSIKRWQHRAGSITSATGALHAVRREFIGPIPADVPDDFYLSTAVRSAHARLAFAPDALAWERPNDRPRAEYRRRVRIITSGLTGVWRRRDLLDPRRHGDDAIVFALHKVGRRLLFLPLIVLALTAFLTRRASRLGRWLWRAQVALYGAAIVGTVAPTSRAGRHPVVALPAHFCNANLAAANAVANLVRGRSYTTWTPERS
jgi:cellulose synthase/poly-beta-1,6-N-acetylglucosamine synthase-like glycosyltransferase